MSKINVKCLAGKLTQFSEEELQEYVSDILSEAKQYDQNMGKGSIRKAMLRVNKSKRRALLQENGVLANDAEKLSKIKTMIADKTYTIRDFFVRSSSNRGLANNVEAAQNAAKGRFYDVFFNELTPEEMRFLQNNENEQDIARAIDGQSSTEMAKSISEKHKKLIETTKSELVSSDSMLLEDLNQYRELGMRHDVSKILSANRSLAKAVMRAEKYTTDGAKKLWMDFIKSKLDWDLTFKGTTAISDNGEIIESEVDKVLENIFNNIVTQKSEVVTKSKVVNDQEAMARRNRMFFHWKDAQSWMDYNSKYGSGDYFTAVMNHIQSSSKRVGSAEILGSNPIQAFLDLRDHQLKINPQKSLWNRNTELAFNQVIGKSQGVSNIQLANFMSNVRALSGIASLGKLAILSLNDVATGAAFAQRWGVGWLKPYTTHLTNLFNLFPDAERKYMAKQFKVMTDSHLGYVGKMLDSNNVSDVVNKLTNGFYRRIGMHALDTGNKVSAMHVISKHLFNMSGRKLGELSDELQKQLSKFDLTEKEWDLLRKNNEMDLFTTANVDKLTNEDLKSLRESGSKKSLENIRVDLHRKVYSIFDVASENAVTNPGAFMRAMMLQDATKGTLHGEFFHSIMQFKSFPVQFIDRALIQGFKNADGAKAKALFAMNMTLLTLPLSVLSETLGYWSEGKTLPDISQMSPNERAKFLLGLIQPNLGVFYKALDPKHENQNLITDMLNTPSTRLMSNALSTAIGLGFGAVSLDTDQMEKGIKAGVKTAASLTPFGSLPFIEPYFNYLTGGPSYMQPGQEKIFGPE
jgi:hypothetical protein